MIVCRGASSERIELAHASPVELARALGPSGNLRAPALRVGTLWLVGFAPDAWAELIK